MLMRRRPLLAALALGSVGLAGCLVDDEEPSNDGGAVGQGGDDGDGSGNETDGSPGDDGSGDDGGDDSGGDQDDSGGEADEDQVECPDDLDVPVCIETTESDCGTGEDNIAIRRIDGPVEIEGILGAPNPCHYAVVRDATVADDTLTIVVDVESEDVECIQCVGEIHYEATVDDSFQSVTVDHVDGGELTVSEAEESPTDPSQDEE